MERRDFSTANLAPHCSSNEYANGSQVDQSFARKAQQEPEGKMEETETAAAAEALSVAIRACVICALGYSSNRGANSTA
jgi:hypothetical protein